MVPRGRIPEPLLLRTHPSTEERTRRLRALIPREERRRLGHSAMGFGHAGPVQPSPVGDPAQRRA